MNEVTQVRVLQFVSDALKRELYAAETAEEARRVSDLRAAVRAAIALPATRDHALKEALDFLADHYEF